MMQISGTHFAKGPMRMSEQMSAETLIVEDKDQESWVGRPLQRFEDARLLTGRGRFVDDRNLPHALHMAVRRSDQPHARIVNITTDAAKSVPGVHGVFVWNDIEAWIKPAIATSRMSAYQPTAIHALAPEIVHYVGEPVVAVLAESRYVAEDALELIEIEYETLPFEGDPIKAAQADAPLLHEGFVSNVLVERAFIRGEVNEAFEGAYLCVGGNFRFHRKTATAMEPRTYLAEPDAGRDSLTLYSSTQVPGIIRDALAELMDMPGNRLDVIAPDVGGGFGGKTSLYQEEMLVCALARKTGRAVRWVGDRLEDLLSTSQAFDEHVEASLAVSEEGKILGLKAVVVGDIGAYSIYPWTAGIEPVQVVSFLPGPYKVPCYSGHVRAVTTPKSPTGPYRGVGRPTSTFVMERLIDMAAVRLGLDPAEIRERNMVQPHEFPYKTPSGIVWDQSAFTEGLQLAKERFGYPQARRDQATARDQGRWIGIGIASYAELSGIGSRISASPGMPINTGTDVCVIQLDSTGSIQASFGCASHGQGHETTLAQVLADELAVDPSCLRVVTGSTQGVPHGTGSYASRTAVISSGAAILAARELRERMLRLAALLLDASPEFIKVQSGVFRDSLTGKQITVAELAKAQYSQMGRVPASAREELCVTRTYDPVVGTTSSSTHMVEIEIDPNTYAVHFLRYLIVEDSGRIINPLIVTGQARGAFAQGVGAALFEEVVYDENGQLLSASLVDYVLPSAPEVPALDLVHMKTVSSTNLGGFRGMGEGGTIGSPAAIANAISDALAHKGVEVFELPMTQQRIFQLINKPQTKTGVVS
jgi:carbon-monoxide dehydrogenase large subunit